MPPADYKKARESKLSMAWVDNRPYLPELIVGVENEESVKAAVAQIMMLLLLNQQRRVNTVPEASQIDSIASALLVERVSGGITNTLYKVSGLQQNLTIQFPVDAVLLRVFGAEGMIDRDDENAIYAALSVSNIAPPYYGRFANGRIEGWMDHMRPLDTTELSRGIIAQGIAASLATLHYGFRLPTELQTKPNLWTQLYDWLEQAEKVTFQTEKETDAAETLQLTEKIRPELAWLKEQVAILIDNKEDAIVFCHNDLLAANIMCDDANNHIQLIDFEYGGVNYRAFDIANHFNEYAGGPPDHSDPEYAFLPDTAQQREFIRTYLQTAAAVRAAASQHDVDDKPNEKASNTKSLSVDHVVTAEQIDTMMPEIQIFLLTNHLYWGLWAVNQAATEGCGVYDYMQYAVNRIKQYWVTKQAQGAC